jgi:hypothetical protein
VVTAEYIELFVAAAPHGSTLSRCRPPLVRI